MGSPWTKQQEGVHQPFGGWLSSDCFHPDHDGDDNEMRKVILRLSVFKIKISLTITMIILMVTILIIMTQIMSNKKGKYFSCERRMSSHDRQLQLKQNVKNLQASTHSSFGKHLQVLPQTFFNFFI